MPVAAPGEAATPVAIAEDDLTELATRGRCSCSIDAGSTREIAVARSMRPSWTIATAIFTAAGAVRFPALV